MSIDLRTITTGLTLRDKHTKERLRVDQYPSAKLVKAVGKDGQGEATIMVSGKTLEVKGTYKVDGQNLRAEFPMKLSQLDITGVRYMNVGVKDDVVVRIELPIKKKN